MSLSDKEEDATLEVVSKEEEEEEEEILFSSDSEIGDALDFLDSRDDFEGNGSISLASRRPNAHGGLLSRPLQPISNKTQKLTSHIRASPLEVAIPLLLGFLLPFELFRASFDTKNRIFDGKTVGVVSALSRTYSDYFFTGFGGIGMGGKDECWDVEFSDDCDSPKR